MGALHKRIVEAACAPQMEFVQWQMAQWQLAQWHAAQMVQRPHSAFANQANQEGESAAQWKEGDTFEVQTAFVTCDRTKTRIEAGARGTVMRTRSTGGKGKMSVKFDNMVNCKWIYAEDSYKMKKSSLC